MKDRIRVGLVGHGVGPSLSPALHMREAAHLGLDYEYVVVDLIDTPDVDLAAEIDRLEDAGFAAVNITHPFKQAALDHVQHHSAVVDVIGSTNLVIFGPRGRTAHNTDYWGFRSGLEDFLGDRPRRAVLQVGAGGAGLATAYALIGMGFERVIIHDRNPAASRALVERFTPHAPGRRISATGDLESCLRTVDGVIHVTPTGMRQHPGTAVDVDLLRGDVWVSEVVYRPLETELVRLARARGLPTLDGGGMAVRQALESLRLITGREPDLDRMSAHFTEIASDASTQTPDPGEP